MHSMHQAPVANMRAAHRAMLRGGSRQSPSEEGLMVVHELGFGRDELSDAHIIDSKVGVFRSRSVCKLLPDRCWSQDAVDSMKWTPWKTASIMRGRPARRSSTGEPIVNAPLDMIQIPHQQVQPHPKAGSSNAKRNCTCDFPGDKRV